MSQWIEAPWMCRPVHLDEIPLLQAHVYHPTGVGPWGFITVGQAWQNITIGYGPVKVCQERVRDLLTRLQAPVYAGSGIEKPLFPEAM